MKAILNVMGKMLGMTMVVGAFQLVLLAPYLVITLDIPLDQIKTIISYGLPWFIILIAFFVVSISAISVPLFSFLLKHSRGEKMEDDYLEKVRRTLINNAYVFSLISLIIYIAGSAIFCTFAYTHLDMDKMNVFLGIVGGVISGALNVIAVIHITNIITPSMVRMINENSDTIPRGARVGFRQGIKSRMMFSLITTALCFLLYISIVSYLLLYRLNSKLESTKDIEVIRSQMDSSINQAGIFYLIVLFVGFAFILFLTRVASTDITKSISVLKDAAAKISGGGFKHQVELVTNDEMGELAEGMNNMASELENFFGRSRNVIEKIDEVAIKLGETSNEIQSVVEQQGAGASEQAVTMEEINATSDTIVGMSKSMSESMSRANEIMKATTEATGAGAQSLNATMAGFITLRGHVGNIAESMDRVNESTEKVGEILDNVDEITEKTNLLALNAAIESAGAGEANTRFNIVAEDIRLLAEEAKGASRDIKGIIEEIRENTSIATMQTEEAEVGAEKGVNLIQVAAKGFEKIASITGELAGLTSDVVVGAKDQEMSLEQVSTSIADVTQAAQEVADGARETQSHLKSLGELADTLRGITTEGLSMNGAHKGA